MADYFNIRAPQWIDFAQSCSPVVQIPDFFEKAHTVHERVEESCDSTTENIENAQPTSQVDVSYINAQQRAELDIIKNTPVKVISPKYRNKETIVATKITGDEVFNDAMKKLVLCKPRDVLNKSSQESKIFKTPNMPKIAKSSRSVGCVLNRSNRSNQDSAIRSTKINKTSSNNVKKILVEQSLFEQNKDSVENDIFKRSNNSVNNPKDKDQQYNKEDNEECKEKDNKEHIKEDDNEEHNEDNKEYNDKEDKIENNKSQVECIDDNKGNKKAENNQDNVDAKGNRMQLNKHVAVLTWQNHRRSIYKCRTSMNKQYIGLAEAVSRFQNETPKRFRTRSNKNNTISPSFYASKLIQNRLKPTIPISPALISKNRTRPVTVLSQEEREKLEIEEMKKYRIKANPIPPNVLRGPRAVTKVKPMLTAKTSSATMNDDKNKSSFQAKSPRDKASSGPKNKINLVVTDADGIIIEHEEVAFNGVPTNIAPKNVTRVMPFSFEARNKHMQMKKEQRLKSLQEASKTKAEFHARPAPNFSKPSTPSFTKPPMPSAKQQQNAKRLPSPFSFEERDRKLSEKKEQLMKQILEESKQSRLFRANPAPVFKPVMIRGTSKEYLSMRNKSIKTGNEHKVEYKCEDQENKKPNEIDSYKTENMQRAAKNSDDKQKVPLKALPLELNTDKRAKERREFDEKLKRKEMEEQIKRQEQERQKLEHEKQLKAELRKLAEVKARPMPKYKPLVTSKATKQLTEPQSPAFASKLRSKQI